MSGDNKRHTKSIREFFPGFKKNTSRRNDQNKVVKKLKPNESALRTCPLCAKDFHWTLIDAHASECLDGGGGDGDCVLRRCSSEKKKKEEEEESARE